MTRRLLAAAAAIAAMVTTLSAQRHADAAEIKVLASNGARGALVELGRQFQDTSGHKLAMDFDVVAPLKRIDAGETFDLVILNPARSTI